MRRHRGRAGLGRPPHWDRRRRPRLPPAPLTPARAQVAAAAALQQPGRVDAAPRRLRSGHGAAGRQRRERQRREPRNPSAQPFLSLLRPSRPPPALPCRAQPRPSPSPCGRSPPARPRGSRAIPVRHGPARRRALGEERRTAGRCPVPRLDVSAPPPGVVLLLCEGRAQRRLPLSAVLRCARPRILPTFRRNSAWS